MKTKDARLEMKGIRIFSILLITILFSIACQNKDEIIDPEIPIEEEVAEIPLEYLNENVSANTNYFTEDSIASFNIDELIYNGLGRGLDTVTMTPKQSLFIANQSLVPIVKHQLDELFTKNIILSWNYSKNMGLVDSILENAMQSDQGFTVNNSRFTSNTTLGLDSSLFVHLVLVKRLGSAKIDYSKSNLNEYLKYKSSLVEGTDKDGISLSSVQFRNIYGNEYTSELVLGNLLVAEFELIHIDLQDANQNSVLREAMSMIKKIVMDDAKWSDLKGNSQYFKNADCLFSEAVAIPRMNFAMSLNDIAKEMTSLEYAYNTTDVGVLTQGFQPFKTLYPTYSF